jgi:hypothetical protein
MYKMDFPFVVMVLSIPFNKANNFCQVGVSLMITIDIYTQPIG